MKQLSIDELIELRKEPEWFRAKRNEAKQLIETTTNKWFINTTIPVLSLKSWLAPSYAEVKLCCFISSFIYIHENIHYIRYHAITF